jgi:transketolase
MSKIATREAYGKALAEFGKDPNIVVLDADLSKSTKTDTFQKVYPERFFNIGIAEANMISIAAGMATCGKTVFASTFAVFASMRACEQIRNSICYPKLNVKIGATHAGISVGEDGASHQTVEDMAIMRSLPNMTIICPCDGIETRAAVKAAIDIKGPVYLRLGRLALPLVHKEEDFSFELGKGIQLKDGGDVTIIATGLMVYKSLEAAEMLKAQGIDARVIDIHTIKPIDKDIIVKAAKETGAIVTVEWDGDQKIVRLTVKEGVKPAPYTQDDLYWLSRLIRAEAEGQPLFGQLAVGAVVMNRVYSKDFPDTVKEVIFQPKQFTPAANGTIYKEPGKRYETVAKMVLNGFIADREALFFLNPDKSTSFWIVNNKTYVASIGDHDFYK